MKQKTLLEKCQEDHIPIVRNKTKDLILSLIKKHNCTSLLEIGTAYGYSCSLWLQNPQLTKIVSIEKLTSNYEIAKSFLTDPRLELINDDAFTYEPTQKYDLIFIDGPKSHQEQLVTKYLDHLTPNGVMVIDNLFLKKFSEIPKSELSKNQIKLLNKVESFYSWLTDGIPGYDLIVSDFDDGVGVLTKHAS